MTTSKKVSEKETGHPGGVTQHGINQYAADPLDHNPELRFPYSIQIFDQMRKTDAQLKALLNACTLPIVGAQWTLTCLDVRPEVNNLALQKLDSRTRRKRQGMVWEENLRKLALRPPRTLNTTRVAKDGGLLGVI